MRDDDFLIERVDEVDNAIWQAILDYKEGRENFEPILAALSLDNEQIDVGKIFELYRKEIEEEDRDWDINLIANIEMELEADLKKPCYPFYTEDENICYAGCDRCPYCLN